VIAERIRRMEQVTQKASRCLRGEAETGPDKKSVSERAEINPPQLHKIINFPKCHFLIFIVNSGGTLAGF